MKTKTLPLIIYWNKLNTSAFLYGTTLNYVKDGLVIFENNLMPSGTIIQEWHSYGGYQDKRGVSPLPLLVPNKQYELIANMVTLPQQSVFIGIQFFDRYNQKLDFKLLKEYTSVFDVPQQTYYYTIQLINAGCHRVEFNHFTLQKK